LGLEQTILLKFFVRIQLSKQDDKPPFKFWFSSHLPEIGFAVTRSLKPSTKRKYRSRKLEPKLDTPFYENYPPKIRLNEKYRVKYRLRGLGHFCQHFYVNRLLKTTHPIDFLDSSN
jgi:hypothetical protein